MNESEQDRLQILVNDSFLLATVDKLFHSVIEVERPRVGDEDNSLLGEKYRAYEETRRIVGRCFRELGSYKRENIESTQTNRAR